MEKRRSWTRDEMPSRSKYGEMYALTPPDLSDAAQIIGLDGTPTIELWNLLFAPERVRSSAGN